MLVNSERKRDFVLDFVDPPKGALLALQIHIPAKLLWICMETWTDFVFLCPALL
jgi:hypothetical protein